jgi:signal transduction histidine kinase
MADIHDTVGAQLVGVLDLIRTKAPHEQLEIETADALEDLRIAIDAIQPVNGSLTVVLATLRHRLEPRLSATGIQLLWHVEALPRLANLTPQMIQHIQRIVLEAISNVMKHAKARTITFTAQSLYEGKTVVIQITDDGLGFDEAALTSTGQGLRTMRFRAEAVGAVLTFSKAEPYGTRLTLTLPIV